jgi:hypothetical protein
VQECRFVDGAVAVAGDVLATGGDRDQLWAAVWVYGSLGADPDPLRPMLAHDDPSIRVMAGALLAHLGDPGGLLALRDALPDESYLIGSEPPVSVSGFAVYTLARQVSAPDLPGPAASPDDAVAVARAWGLWLDEHVAALAYDPSTGEWSMP